MIEPLKQTDLPGSSGIPRFGCYFMCPVAMPQLVRQIAWGPAVVMSVFDECRETRAWDFGRTGHHVIDYGPATQYPYGKEFDCYLWDPGAVLDIACRRLELRGWQTCDATGWYSWAPADRRFLSFIVRQIQRPRGFHYDLADAARVGIYNPLPQLGGPLTGHWIGFAVGAPA
jgi:hypothetical protein